MSIARLDGRVASVARCFVQKEKREGRRQKVYADTYGETVETTKK